MEKKFKVADGRIVELGPQVIEFDTADMEEWRRLYKGHSDRKAKFKRKELLFDLARGTKWFIMLFFLTFPPKPWKFEVPILLAIFLLWKATEWYLFHCVYMFEKRQVKAAYQERRQELLAKYGDYPLSEVATLDEWSHSHYWGSPNAKYVLIGKGAVI